MHRTLWLLTIAAALLLFACSHEEGPQVQEHTFIGTIQDIHGDSALVTIEEGEILKSGKEVMVDLSVEEERNLQIGDQIKVGYDGTVRESHPLGIHTLYVERLQD